MRGYSTSQWPAPAVSIAMLSSLKRMSLSTLAEAASCGVMRRWGAGEGQYVRGLGQDTLCVYWQYRCRLAPQFALQLMLGRCDHASA
jgi:hypothetical protein